MHLTFSPRGLPERLKLSRYGDTLCVNDRVFDFTDLPDGAILPRGAISGPGSEWFAGPVQRIGGVLHLRLVLPHSDTAPEETRFPKPITVTHDGDVELPPWGDDPQPDSNRGDAA